MANPQVEEGYTRIANAIMEALAKIRVPGETRQVVDVVFRKTYGFNKKFDRISLSQFSLATGLRKPNVVRALKTAARMHIIIVFDNGGYHFYKINKNFETWKPLSKLIKPVIEIDNSNKDIALKNNDLSSQNPLSKLIMTTKPLSKLIKPVIEIDNSVNINTKEKGNPHDSCNDRPKKLKKLFLPSSFPYKLAEQLFELILQNNPFSRLHSRNNGDREATLQRWAGDFDLLIRKDKQKPSLIEDVIKFAAHDDFWGPNIQSGSKLRTKWDILVSQMKKKEKKLNDAPKSYDAAGRSLNYV